jgi:endonuclease V-like protein UPF0215 family
MRRLANVLGVDDAPHGRDRRRVPIVGVVTARDRMDGVLVGHVQRDGRNATDRIAALLRQSPFDHHVQAVLLQGLTFGGFNVVDLPRLQLILARPVLVVVRRRPDLKRIERALGDAVPGGRRKWELVQRAGEIEATNGVFIQRAGLSQSEARHLLTVTTRHGKLPEALRLAHLIGAALVTGRSRGGA